MIKILSTTYVPLQPPYKIIKHGRKMGVQIGIQRMIFSGSTPSTFETHDYPVVAKEDATTPFKDLDIPFDNSNDGEVWDNVESKLVSVLGIAGKTWSWEDFIKTLWHDHARLNNPAEEIQKNYIFSKIINYNHSQLLPPPDIYDINLHIVLLDGKPYVVRSAKDDVFALNVPWSDDPVELEKRIVKDLMKYLLIISPNTSARYWHLHYKSDKEQLQPLVKRLNANPRATSFKNALMAQTTVKYIRPYEDTSKGQFTITAQPSSKEKGRGKAPDFETYIFDTAPKGFIDVLEEMLNGKTGRTALTIILAATGVWIKEPKPQSVVNRFPSVKKTSYVDALYRHKGLNSYMGKAIPIPEEDIESVREEIKIRLKETDNNN